MPLRFVRLLAVSLGTAAFLFTSGCGSAERTIGEPLSGVPSPSTSVYRLRPGDAVRVRVLTDEDQSYTTPITPAGTIIVPSGAEVVAAGLSVAQLADAVEAELVNEFLDPSVSIVLVEVASQHVFVLGAVERPARIDFKGGLSVSMVLAEAGGVMASGKASSVMIVRTAGQTEPVAFRVDIAKVLSGRDLSEDVALLPNDIVYVPKSVIGKVGEFVELFFNNIAPAQLFYLRGYQMLNPEGEIIVW